MIDVNTLRALARNMARESDEPSDIRGLRARAVAEAADQIERLRAGYEQILDWHEQLPQDQKTVRLAREMLGRLDETETREPE